MRSVVMFLVIFKINSDYFIKHRYWLGVSCVGAWKIILIF